MPYELRQTGKSWRLRLWPHNALAPRGFAAVIGFSAAVLAVPLLALWALWHAIQRNWRDRSVFEEMDLSRRELHLRRVNPRGPVQEWRADPHWVTLHISADGGPVEQYLTLTGGGREVELGAFLTPEERIALHGELADLLIRLKSYA